MDQNSKPDDLQRTILLSVHVFTWGVLPCLRLYTLTVTARDQDPVSPRSDTAVLIVNVLDLNDNMPIFSPALYIENNIVENQLTVSIPLQASDADSGANAMISYSIIAGNHGSTFQIGLN